MEDKEPAHNTSQLVSLADDVPLCLNTADEAIDEIRKHYSFWQKEQRRQ